MNHQGDDAYRFAMNAAMDKLGTIDEESKRLSNRVHQLDSLLEALKPFMTSREQTAAEDRQPMYRSIDRAAESVHANELTPQMIGLAIPQVVPQQMIESTDPIQRRINSVLGLAIA